MREASLLPPYLSTRPTARLLAGLFVALGAFAWIAVGFDLAEIRFLGRQADGIDAAPIEVRAFELTARILGMLRGALLLGAVGLFAAWLYRSRVNVRAFGARRLRFSRNWTVAGLLIPVANLVLPYRVMHEIWQASDPSTITPLDWKVVRPGRLLSVWWGSVVVWVALVLVTLFLTEYAGHSASRLQLARSLALVADLGAALAASLGYFVVNALTDAQEAKWQRIEAAEA